jgi:hypothetical protein
MVARIGALPVSSGRTEPFPPSPRLAITALHAFPVGAATVVAIWAMLSCNNYGKGTENTHGADHPVSMDSATWTVFAGAQCARCRLFVSSVYTILIASG